MAAAVLGYVQGGILVIAGIGTLNGGSTFSDLNLGIRGSGMLTILGILALVAAGLLISGGVSALSKRPWLLVAGSALSLLLSVWWSIQFDFFNAIITWSLLFAVMPIIALALVLGRAAKTWMATPG